VALACVRSLVAERMLDLSVFYHDDERGIDSLVDALVTPDHVPTVFPTKTSFDAANRKIDGMRYARKAGVPTPESAVCHDLNEVLAFYHDPTRSHRGVFIKSDHRRLVRALTDSEIKAAAPEFSYPLLVETLYDVVLSPSVNMVLWQGERSSFAVTDQILHHWIHYGNAIPSVAARNLSDKIIEYSGRIGDAIPDLQGVFGVDYIITPDHELYAVDINPRFCSGTYPQHFLQRMGISLDNVFACYRLVHCNVDSLSTVLSDPEFVPLTIGAPDGILIYDPVVYETEKPVNYFSFVAVAETKERVTELEQVMERMVEKFPPLAKD
jgi:hypothetical protein